MPELPILSRTSQLQNQFASVMLYAIAKMGKTRLAAETSPEPLILANETGDTAGLQSVKDLDVPYVLLPNWETTVRVVAELKKVSGKCQYQGTYFKTIIVDSFSGCGRQWLDLALQHLGWKEVGMSGPGHDTRRPYGFVAEKGRQAMKLFMSIDAHLVLICREGIAEEGEGDDKRQYPCIELPGSKLFKELPGDPDATVRLRMVNGQRVLVTQPENGAIAGVRKPGDVNLNKYIIPNIGLLIEAMLGGKEAASKLNVISAKPETKVVALPRTQR